MNEANVDDQRVASHEPKVQLAKLIRKLRWIGLEEEAQQLQRVASTLPPEETGSVSVGPFPTD